MLERSRGWDVLWYSISLACGRPGFNSHWLRCSSCGVCIFITICFSRLTTSWLTPWLEGAGNSRRRTHRGSADWPSAHALAGGALHERQGANRWPPGLRASKQQCYSLLLHINVACSSCFLLPRNHCFDPRCGVVLIDDCCCHGVHAHKQTKSDPLGDQILDYILDKCAFY